MKTILILGWGGLLVVMGLGLLGWITYNLLVEMQPSAEGRSPVGPLIFAVSMIAVGTVRIIHRLIVIRNAREREEYD